MGVSYLDQIAAESYVWALSDFLDFLFTWAKQPSDAPIMEPWDLTAWFMDEFMLPEDVVYPRGRRNFFASALHQGFIPVNACDWFDDQNVYTLDQLDAAFAAWSGSVDYYHEPEPVPVVDLEPYAVFDEGSAGSLAWLLEDRPVDDDDF